LGANSLTKFKSILKTYLFTISYKP
jgi:hypothetical protein